METLVEQFLTDFIDTVDPILKNVRRDNELPHTVRLAIEASPLARPIRPRDLIEQVLLKVTALSTDILVPDREIHLSDNADAIRTQFTNDAL